MTFYGRLMRSPGGVYEWVTTPEREAELLAQDPPWDYWPPYARYDRHGQANP